MTSLPPRPATTGASGLPEQLPASHRVLLMVDMVESVRWMQTHEQEVVTVWQAFLAHVIQSALPVHGGRFVKSRGDGLLAEFSEPRGAVAAAMAMHRWMAEHAAGSACPPLQLRAGIHSAEVYSDGQDLYGAGVNLAERLSSLAAPAQTVVSTAIRDELIDAVDGVISDLGECYLKHIDTPVRAWRVAPVGPAAIGPAPSAPAPAPAPIELRVSIAVIPFTSRANSPGEFAVGELIADGVIGMLSQTRELRVIARLSTAAYRGRESRPREAGSRLGADYLMSGSYAVQGDNILIVGELVESRSEEVVCAVRLSGRLADLFEQQSDLCSRLANDCHQALMERHAAQSTQRPLPNLQSFTLMLGGVSLMHRSSAGDFLRAREALDTVVERHGRAAAPRVWLAKWHVLRSTRSLGGDRQAEAAAALDHTRRALDAEPENALALAMQGFVYCHLLKDMDRASVSCEQAVKRSANEPLAWLFLAMVRAFDGDGVAAWPAGQRALTLSPVDPLRYYYDSLMASVAISARRYDDAIAFAQSSLRANAFHLSSYRALALAQALGGEVSAARTTMADVLQKDPSFSIARFQAGYPSRDRVPGYLKTLTDALRMCAAPEH